MAEEMQFEVTLQSMEGFRFDVGFDLAGMGALVMDEPVPLGEGSGPNASRLLAAAVGNCLSASLLFCLRKAHLSPTGVRTTVQGAMARNDKGRLRIAKLDVTLDLSGEFDAPGRCERCLEMFEEYCVVSASVRQGIPVDVVVRINGEEVHRSA